MGAQLKPHDYSVVLPPTLIAPVSDVNIAGCYCFYVPSNGINSTAAASGTGDETAGINKQNNNLYSASHLC